MKKYSFRSITNSINGPCEAMSKVLNLSLNMLDNKKNYYVKNILEVKEIL